MENASGSADGVFHGQENPVIRCTRKIFGEAKRAGADFKGNADLQNAFIRV